MSLRMQRDVNRLREQLEKACAEMRSLAARVDELEKAERRGPGRPRKQDAKAN